MVCGKAGVQAASFTAAGMSSAWSQRSEQITSPVDSKRPYTLNTAGVGFQEGARD
jgi:hypothetical protein